MTAPSAPTPPDGGRVVEVQETRIFATGLGADWWLDFMAFHQRSGRIETVAQTPQGGLYRVACDDQEHAMWLRNHMVSVGIPTAAVKVVSR